MEFDGAYAIIVGKYKIPALRKCLCVYILVLVLCSANEVRLRKLGSAGKVLAALARACEEAFGEKVIILERSCVAIANK